MAKVRLIVEHLVVFCLGRIDHLDRFVHPRIKGLPHRLNRLDAEFLQRILKLAIDEFETAAEIAGVPGCRSL